MEEAYGQQFVRVSGASSPGPSNNPTRSQSAHLFRWVHALAARMEQIGLKVVAEDKHKNPDHYLPIAAQTVFLGLAEYLYKDPAIEKYQESLAQEHSKESYVDVIWTCVVSRKAL